MKVVLFCGGYGLRMRSGASDDIPKPMAMVGPRPLIWHVMRTGCGCAAEPPTTSPNRWRWSARGR
ncbi:hypothetical protein AN219_06805 [Streptomyces nanshensis]|nr:hypothetical protein AN219_06805 [Streptomyces nanshensis]